MLHKDCNVSRGFKANPQLGTGLELFGNNGLEIRNSDRVHKRGTNKRLLSIFNGVLFTASNPSFRLKYLRKIIRLN